MPTSPSASLPRTEEGQEEVQQGQFNEGMSEDEAAQATQHTPDR
jgi:hypothetical protein